MLIEPTGRANVLCMGDQIHAETPFSCWGVSMPQSSVEPDVLNAACKKVAEACKSRGIIGYLSVDFVTFIDSKTVSNSRHFLIYSMTKYLLKLLFLLIL